MLVMVERFVISGPFFFFFFLSSQKNLSLSLFVVGTLTLIYILSNSIFFSFESFVEYIYIYIYIYIYVFNFILQSQFVICYFFQFGPYSFDFLGLLSNSFFFSISPLNKKNCLYFLFQF